MDRDGNGVLDKREFESGMKSFGMNFSSREMDSIMNYFDHNNSGYIGYADFADVIESS